MYLKPYAARQRGRRMDDRKLTVYNGRGALKKSPT